MKSAVIYTRVSTAEQAIGGTSLQTQEQACRSWAESRGFRVAKLFSDQGETAKTADRPQFLELISWCAQHKPDVCIVWKFDRWARNSTDHAVAAAAIAKHGARLVSATEAAADDPAGRLLQTILAGIAQFDNEVRAERSRTAMRSVAMRGGWFTHAPLGFMYSRSGSLPILVEDAEHAPIVRDLFAGLASRRRTLAQTVAVAREHDIPEKRVRKLLRAPVYAGIIRSKLTNGRDIQAAFPGLVNRDTWLAAQDAIDGRQLGSYTKQRPDFPLRGILQCPDCRKLVTACYSRGKTRRYAYYQCKDGHVRARAEIVHDSWIRLLSEAKAIYAPMLYQIKATIRDVVQERIEAAQSVERDASQEVQRLRGRRARLLDAFLGGALEGAEFAARDSDLALRIQVAEETSRQKTDWSLDVESAISMTVQILENPIATWERLDVQLQQRFAFALYGQDLYITSAGECRTLASDCPGGVLGAMKTLSIHMARPRGEVSNCLIAFVDAARKLADLAA